MSSPERANRAETLAKGLVEKHSRSISDIDRSGEYFFGFLREFRALREQYPRESADRLAFESRVVQDVRSLLAARSNAEPVLGNASDLLALHPKFLTQPRDWKLRVVGLAAGAALLVWGYSSEFFGLRDLVYPASIVLLLAGLLGFYSGREASRLREICAIAILVAVMSVVFATLVVSFVYTGETALEESVGGVYFLTDHGNLTEVSRQVFSLVGYLEASLAYGVGLFIATYPLLHEERKPYGSE